MQRFKILIGLALFVLCLSALKPMFNKEAETVVPTAKLDETLVDHKEIQLYKSNQQALKEAIESYFNKAIASGDIVGAGVSIVQRDSIVISEGYGKKNITLNKKVNGETVFRLGSLSKGFAGILAASLNNEGKLHWDDRISEYIPEFHLGDKPNIDNITLANVLSHTSGTPYHSYTDLVEAGFSLSDIAKRFKNVNPISKPGLTYSYQNAMFALCGEVMYKATGQDITALLNEKFFKPLDMQNTSMDNETLIHTENVALPHSQSRYKFRTLKLNDKYYNAVAAGGINASALDMAKWMRFLLGHNPEIMDKSAFEDAFNPFIEIKEHGKYYQKWSGHLTSYYGYGWRIHKYLEDISGQEKTILHHGGSVNNYRNEIALFPEDDLGICVLLNSNSKLAQTVIPDLQKIVNDIYRSNTLKVAATSPNEKAETVF
ncbi:serine hydrolase domain-containing protein [Confluentibacter citreus]|uniref:serine hydrolase domain-containing protein n=1 Tax=Confluentibacter citreus TaxID=2007307 RepID=UPI000C290A63|nr:serine hydrolase domain-containing protein [Confluentibacter citreus]